MEKQRHIKTMDLNNEFEFLDGSYSIPDIQDYFEYVFKRHETLPDNPQMKLLTLLTFKWVYLELLTTELMKLLGNTEKI